jgi:hypothetical protein
MSFQQIFFVPEIENYFKRTTVRITGGNRRTNARASDPYFFRIVYRML